MNCLDCTLNGSTTTAVATCSHCGAAVCLRHADVGVSAPRPQGTVSPARSRRLVQCLQCGPDRTGKRPAPSLVARAA